MTVPEDLAGGSGEPNGGKPFHAVLRPNRSLGPRGFLMLMSVLAAISFAAGMVFVSMGAWPVFGFFGLDVALVYVAFRLNYRSGRLFETIDIGARGATVERVHPDGQRERWEFEPYWLRVEIEGDEETGAELRLASHGRRVILGSFLAHGEKIELGQALQRALAHYKA